MEKNRLKTNRLGKITWTLLAFIIIVAAVIRLGELHTYGPTPGDDVSYLNNIRSYYNALRKSLDEAPRFYRIVGPFLVANQLTQKQYHEMAFTSLAKPLYVLKLAIIEGTVGLTLYRQHLAVAVVGILSVFVVFAIGRKLFGEAAGLIAAFLMAISPWAIRYSTYGIASADSLFLLLLIFWLLVSRRLRLFLVGLLLGITLLVNPTVAYSVLILVAVAVMRSWLDIVADGGEGRRQRIKLLKKLIILGIGFLLIPVLWEIANWWNCQAARVQYKTFWASLGETTRDNITHAALLPVDPLFWFRLVAVTEGWSFLVLGIVSIVWLAGQIRKRERTARFRPVALLLLIAGTIIMATWSGSTQCARHYIFAWSLGLIAIGGMISDYFGVSTYFLRKKWSVDDAEVSTPSRKLSLTGAATPPAGSWRFLAKKTGLHLVMTVLIAFSLLDAAKHLLRYRYSRQGDYRLKQWMEENMPANRLVTPANQPPNMWKDVRRFNNWDELKLLEEKEGPIYIVYGDYLAITRGIWDYPFDLFPIAQACRAVESEIFRTGTHLSDPSFIYENEDYYWGFIRQGKEAFEPDVRVIPVREVLPYRDNPPWPDDAKVVVWQRGGDNWGYNVYWPFTRFSLFPYRSLWLAVGLISFLFLGSLYLVWFSPPPVRELLRRHSFGLIFGVILLTGLIFRSYGLAQFTQMGGDDVEYRVCVENEGESPKYQGLGPAAPFALAAQLSQLDVNETITSFAKPLFLMERSFLEFTIGASIKVIHFWACLQGVATIAVVFFIGVMFGGVLAGAVAAALWAFSPWAVTYSTWGIHVAGGMFWFSLAVWAYLRYRRFPSNKRALIAGLFLGISIMYSSSNIWPSFCLLIIDLAYRLFGLICLAKKRRATVVHLGFLGSGMAVILLGWELMSWTCSRLVESSYLSFPQIILSTMKDNILHASALPVDLLFFWRHLFVSEGPLVGIGVLAAVAWALWMTIRRRAPETAEILLALLFGITVTMNYTGGSQVIRHFFPAWLPLTLLAGWAASLVIRWKGKTAWILLGVGVFLLFTQWDRLQVFRLARWAPSRVQAWSETNYIAKHVATLTCQNMSLWPGLRPISSWEDLEELAKQTPPGVMMYSDYIEIAHGSWFYTYPQYYEISEVARFTKGDLFRTPSYLSYKPALFENEFYYWGLFREPFPDFDSAIRILPINVLLKSWEEISSDPERLDKLWAPTKKPAPLKLAARPDDIQRPFMDARRRPSYKFHLIVSVVVLIGLAWLASPHKGSNLH